MISVSRRPKGRATRAVAAASVFAAVAGVLAPSPAVAEGTFVSAPLRKDVVHDAARGVLYITAGPQVLRYDIASGAFLPPFQPVSPGANAPSLVGIDLSPDGNTLLVADQTPVGASNRVWVIDLTTGTIRDRQFPLDPLEAGTYAVAFGADGRALVTSRFAGSGWNPLRRFDPATDAVQVLREVRQDTMVSASADRSVIAFAEANTSGGGWGRYDVAGGAAQSSPSGTSAFNFEIAAAPAGAQFAVPTYAGGVKVYDSAFVQRASLTAPGFFAAPIGVAYHPFDARLYVAYSDASLVRVYDTGTFQEVGSHDLGAVFNWVGNDGFVVGRLRFSRDGAYLFGTVPNGVRVIGLYAPLKADAKSLGATAGEPAAVTLTGSIGRPGPIGFRVVTPPKHGTLGGTPPELTYTADPAYSGPDSFGYVATYNGAESAPAAVAIQVAAAANRAPTAVDDSATGRAPQGVLIAVLSNDADPEGGAITVASVGAPANGTAALNPDGTITYKPAKKFKEGTDSFTYTVKDAAGLVSAPATVTVTLVRPGGGPKDR